MKLRIKGDSLRLRVSRSELARLLAGGRLEETVHFGAARDARLTYALEIAPQASPVRVRYQPQEVTVLLSEDQAHLWGREGEIGVYTTIAIGSESSLEVVVEKDFACLDRSDDENSDAFANPHAGKVC
jgi:hypothetical protein